MNKSTLFHSFLIITLLYSFNNSGNALTARMRDAANRGIEDIVFTGVFYTLIASGYAIKNSIKKTADPSFIRALKPAIMVGSGLTLLHHICDSLHKSSGISPKSVCTSLIPGLAGLGIPTFIFWNINKWVIERHENKQKTKDAQD